MKDKQAELAEEYQLRFQGAEAYRDGVWKILTKDFFSRYVRPDHEVLDLGCGWGEFINNIEARSKLAMDLNPEAKTKLASDVTFINQDCSETWQLADNSLDVIFTSNFIEHLPNKTILQATVLEARRCLKPGGRLVCLGPNIAAVPGLYWDYWDHHIALTDNSLAELLTMTGFEVSEKIARFLPYTMSNGKSPPLLFVRCYLRLPLVWRYFGSQFLVVADKPRS